MKTVHREFIRYVSLNVLSMLGLSAYILADTIFVANGLGSDGLAALNLVLPVYSFINGTGLMIGMGSATRYSILQGEGRSGRASRAFTLAVTAGLLIGLCLTAIGFLFAGNIAGLLGADTSTLPFAKSYLGTILAFSCAFIVNNVFVCVVRNDNNPNLAMAAMLAGSIGNIILDYIFIFPLQMGMFGAALATGMAPVMSMLVLSLHLLKGRNRFHLRLGELLKEQKKNLEELKNLFSLGLPSFITEFSSGIIMLLFNFTILGLAGNTGVAAYGVVANLALIVTAVFTGIAQGIQPLISRDFGRQEWGNIRVFLRNALVVAVGLGALFYAVGLLFPEEIAGVFNRDGDVLLNEMARSGIRLYFLAFVVMGINIVTTTYLASTAKALESFFLSMFRGCVMIVVLILILPRIWGMTGVWLTIPLTEITAVAGAIFLLKRCKGGISDDKNKV